MLPLGLGLPPASASPARAGIGICSLACVRNWLWFISSYAPLWAMFALRFEATWLRVLFVLLCAFGVLVAVDLLRRGRQDRPSNTLITITGDAGSEISGYLAAYLLPFLTIA